MSGCPDGYDLPMRRGRGLVVTGIVATVLSMVVGVISIGMFFSGLVGGVEKIAQSRPYRVPVQVEPIFLEKGPYVVYVSGSRLIAGIGASDIKITAPFGSPVEVTEDYFEHIDVSSGRFNSIAKFTAPQAGTYLLDVAGKPGAGELIVSKGALSVLGGAAMAGLLGTSAGLGFVVGLVLLFVGLLRRRGNTPPGAGPPGYAQPPYPGYQQPGYQQPGYPPHGPS